jgi:hypothetical protein
VAAGPQPVTNRCVGPRKPQRAGVEVGEADGVAVGTTSTGAPGSGPEIPAEVALISAVPMPAAKKLPGPVNDPGPGVPVFGSTVVGSLLVQVVDALLVISWVLLSLKVPTA